MKATTEVLLTGDMQGYESGNEEVTQIGRYKARFYGRYDSPHGQPHPLSDCCFFRDSPLSLWILTLECVLFTACEDSLKELTLPGPPWPHPPILTLP